MSAAGFGLGGYNNYVAIVRTGGIDTVDNEYSYRATPTSVSFTELKRFSGNSAKSQSITNVKNTFNHFRNLIGLDYDDPIATQEMQYGLSKFIKMEDGSVGVETSYLGQKTTFSVTQLVAIMITDLKQTLLRHVPLMPDFVVNVPVWFTERQRRALLSACSIAGVAPKDIITDSVAVCLAYCIFRTELSKDEKEAKIVAFIDMGYTSTQVCIASLCRNKIKVLACKGTNTIGGRVFDFLLFSKFCAEFASKHNLDVRNNPKAVLKLVAECEKLKKTMNTTSVEMPLRIECFMNDIDFVSKTSRDEMDKLAENVYHSLSSFILSVVSEAKIDPSKVHAVETIGGSCRVLGVKAVISKIFGKELSSSLNADEAVARGCAIQCALVSPMVKIREITVMNKISETYKILYKSTSGEPKEAIVIKAGDVVPSVREVKFKPQDDFSFDICTIGASGDSVKVAKCSLSGNSVKECNPEKLVVVVHIGISSIFQIGRAYLLEKRVEVPASDADETKSNGKPESEFKAEQHVLSVDFKHYQSDGPKVALWKSEEVEMLNRIIFENERSSSKNSLEEQVYSLRDKMASSLFEFMTPQEHDDLQASLSKEGDWLYCEGEFESADTYKKHLEELQSLSRPYFARFESFQKCSFLLDQLSHDLAHQRKFLDQYTKDPSSYPNVTVDEFKDYEQLMTKTSDYVIQSANVLKQQAKTSLPKVDPMEIESRAKDFTSLCNKFVQKANTPLPEAAPPKPMETETETQPIPATETNGTNGVASDPH